MEQVHVGLDFGTSTTLVAATLPDGRAEVLQLGATRNWLPSAVWVGQNGDLVVGEQAEQQAPRSRLVRSVKACITERQEFVPMSDDGTDGVEADSVIAAILEEVVRRVDRADSNLLRSSDLHLGCPALWDRAQRERLITVANQVGLDVGVDSLIDEPIAAAVSWVRGRRLRELPLPTEKLLVFDYGGGTLDVAVVSVLDGEVPELTVESAEGLALAGDALDEAIAGILTQQLEQAGSPLEQLPDPRSAAVLVGLAARDLKETLSSNEEAQRLLPAPYDGIPALRLDRTELEEQFGPLLEGALVRALFSLRSAELRKVGGLTPTEIRRLAWEEFRPSVEQVILAGGFAQVPLVARRFGELLPDSQVGFDDLGLPQESVVMGLAYGGRYFKLNLHRPAFDIWAVYYDRAQQPITSARSGQLGPVPGRKAVGELVYPAFSPLYDPASIFRGEFNPGTRHELSPPRKAAHVELLCQSVDGRELEIVVSGDRKLERLIQPIVYPRGLRFELLTTGEIRFGDTRVDTKMRVAQWPYLKSRGYRIEIDESSSGFYDYGRDYRLGDW